MRVIFAEIRTELVDIDREVDMLRRAIALFEDHVGPADHAWRWLAIQGLGSGVEKIYSGCERVMVRIAGEFDGARVEKDDRWHVSLLTRMAHSVPNRRKR